LASSAPYIALIASKNRAELMRRYLHEEDIGETAMQRVVAPAGMDFEAQSPAEIALAIATDIVTRFRKPENYLTEVTL
jgi:xanthine dehydrogenase accessory factor